MKYSQQCSN